MAVDAALMQVALAIRHGGIGFRAITTVGADAALLAGAAKAEAAMADAPPQRRPRAGASRAPLLHAWHRVHDAVARNVIKTAADRDLPDAKDDFEVAAAALYLRAGSTSRHTCALCSAAGR